MAHCFDPSHCPLQSPPAGRWLHAVTGLQRDPVSGRCHGGGVRRSHVNAQRPGFENSDWEGSCRPLWCSPSSLGSAFRSRCRQHTPTGHITLTPSLPLRTTLAMRRARRAFVVNRRTRAGVAPPPSHRASQLWQTGCSEAPSSHATHRRIEQALSTTTGLLRAVGSLPEVDNLQVWMTHPEKQAG